MRGALFYSSDTVSPLWTATKRNTVGPCLLVLCQVANVALLPVVFLSASLKTGLVGPLSRFLFHPSLSARVRGPALD